MASVLNHRIEFENSIKIEAFDEEWKSVGVFESIKIAERKLFIRQPRINSYLNGERGYTFKGKKRGVTSYKTGKRYHFKKVTNE